VQLFRIIVVAAALLTVVGQYVQEMHRLTVVRRLSGMQAREYYERTRQRRERMLVVVTVLMAAIAVAAGVSAFLVQR